MKHLYILLAILALLQLNCSNRNREAEAARKFAEWEANGIAKIKVDEHGNIYLNNQQTSLDTLSEELARLKKANGAVWYYRVSQSKLAEASGMAITEKIVEYKLPVKMCSGNAPCRKDFE